MNASSIPGKPLSMWIDTAPATQYAGILGDFEADVLIVGGGIVGLSTAEHLMGSGFRVAVIEARQLLGGVTGFTTGKLTILHGLIYKRLIDKFGIDKAKLYAEANQWSIDYVREQVKLHQIDCAFADEHAYTYTTSHINQQVIQQEVEAAQQLGLPATFETPVDQPFPIAGAIRLPGQARFHPRQYLLDVARRFVEGGGRIFENVIAKDVHERDGKFEVLTSGGVISCSSLVIASHVPFYDNSSFYARLTQHRSYAIALKLNGDLPDGMFINVEEPIRSMRRHTLDGEDVLIVGGEGHPVGTDEDTVERYMALIDWAYKYFSVNDVLYHWSTQDNETIDGLPYVGRSSKNHNHLYVATGFNGWGMSNGIAAGKLLADVIKGVANPWEALYDPNRGELKGLAKLMKQGFDVASHFVGDKLKRGEQSNLSPTGAWNGQVDRHRRWCDRHSPEPGWHPSRGVGQMHPHGVHGSLEYRRADLGLSVPRQQIRPRWFGVARPGSGASAGRQVPRGLVSARSPYLFRGFNCTSASGCFSDFSISGS